DNGNIIERHPVPESHREIAETMRTEMIEKIVENDEFLTEKYLMEESISNDELLEALRAATLAGRVQAVLCGSSLKNKGVQLMLDRVIDLLPSPLDIPPVTGKNPRTEEDLVRHADDEEPLDRKSTRLNSSRVKIW